MDSYAKFTGSQFQVSPLDPQKVQFFKGSGEIEKVTNYSGNAGNEKTVYSIKPKFVDWSEGETETSAPVSKSITHFSKNITASQKLRWWIEKRWENEGSLGDRETYYQKIMSELIQNQQDLSEEAQ